MGRNVTALAHNEGLPMPASASPDDFRGLLQHRRDDAKAALGNETSQLQSKAAAQGRLRSGYLGLQYIAATERAWRALVDTSLDDLRRFTQRTNLEIDMLVSAAREELSNALAHLREASKFDGTAGGSFRDSNAAMHRFDEEWAKLPPYLDLKLRQFELGVDQPASAPPASVTYSITAETISEPIQQGSHGSTQTVVVSGDTLFAKLEATIENEIAGGELQAELLALLKELQASQGKPGFLPLYQRFMAAAANHMTILAPFLPALAQLIGR